MIKRTYRIVLDKKEEFDIVSKWASKYPETVKILLNTKGANCPFPDNCSAFPCKTLNCNSDVCSNGYSYRQS